MFLTNTDTPRATHLKVKNARRSLGNGVGGRRRRRAVSIVDADMVNARRESRQIEGGEERVAVFQCNRRRAKAAVAGDQVDDRIQREPGAGQDRGGLADVTASIGTDAPHLEDPRPGGGGQVEPAHRVLRRAMHQDIVGAGRAGQEDFVVELVVEHHLVEIGRTRQVAVADKDLHALQEVEVRREQYIRGGGDIDPEESVLLAGNRTRYGFAQPQHGHPARQRKGKFGSSRSVGARPGRGRRDELAEG